MKQIKKISCPELLALFGMPLLLNIIACKIAIPYLNGLNILPIEATYFLSVGLIVLVPMFFGSLILTKNEIQSSELKLIFERMRIKKLSKADWFWTIGTFLFLCITSGLIAKIIMPKFGIDATPFFFKNIPLQSDHMWILYVWPIFFFFNIFGEEFLWRGFIQPRQELLNKKYTWLIHGILWATWHIPMGIDLIMASLPIFFVLPAIVQFRKNTSISIIVHMVFGAFGFLAIALGMIH